MKDRRRSVAGILVGGILGAGTLLALAGPLDPPAGPVAGTHKTLTEVEPRIAINATNTPGDADSLFKITQPGSYYLTGNVTGVAGKHGIEIVASNVSIDLMGFSLAGIAGMGNFDGVSSAAPSLFNITVRNGTVSGWGDNGIDLQTFITNDCTVTDVQSSDNVGEGIALGTGAIVTRCLMLRNGEEGVSMGSGCALSFCSAGQNGGTGFDLSFGCVISECTAASNAGNGFFGSGGNTIARCVSRGNAANGIWVVFNSLVIENTCSFDGASGGDAAGIRVTGGDNRIEGNNCTSADRGIDVDASGNLIIRNSCAGNATDWTIVANNVYGPIIDRRAPRAAVNGFAAASTLGSTDSNANFSY